MADYKVNELCIVGNPSCNWGFNSARMCFIARPSDIEFQLEEDIISTILKERNYETYVALQNIDPGNFAFCTKICSKIISSHFCIVILNQSKHDKNNSIKIPNPNVHFEYGLMLAFHKHVIPIQKENESLPFNIYPIDTLKYRPDNFKQKVENAIDDAILRFKTNLPPGKSIGIASDIIKYFSFKGMRYSDTFLEPMRTIYSFGSMYGFDLFDGATGIVFFGFFSEEEAKEIVIRTKFLINNIDTAYQKIQSHYSSKSDIDRIRRTLDEISIELLVSETSPKENMFNLVEEYQTSIRKIPVQFHKPSDIDTLIKKEYDKIIL